MNALIALALCSLVSAADATKIMEDSDKRHRLAMETVKATMTLQAQGGAAEQRTYTTTIAQDDSEGDKLLVRFATPADIAGTAFLTLEGKDRSDEQWLYLPAFKKTRRLGSAELGDRFVGSDLFYEDLRRHRVADYAHTLLREEAVDGVPCYVIETVPTAEKVKRESPYGKTQAWLRKDNLVAVRLRNFDKRGRPSKEVTTTKLVQVAGNAWRADHVEVTDVVRKHRTVIDVISRDVTGKVPATTFSPQGLASQ